MAAYDLEGKMEKKEVLKEIHKRSKGISIFLYSITITFIVLFNYKKVLTYSALKNNTMLYAKLIAVDLFAVALLLYFLWYFTDKAEVLFLIVSIPAVLAFGLFMLPGLVPDEGPHLWQATALFTRKPSGFLVPTALSSSQLPRTYSDMYSALQQTDSWSATYVCDRFLDSYLPHLYIVPSIIFAIGHTLNINVLLCAVIGRVSNGVLFLIAGYGILRLVPYGKTAILIFLLNPILIQQEASCSADAIANIVAFLYIAWMLSIQAEGNIKKRNIVVLVLLSVLLVFSKIMYAPLLLLYALFLKRIPSHTTRIFVSALLAFALCAATVLIIVFYHGSFLPEAFDLLRHPLQLIRILVKSLWIVGPFWISSYAGANLGALSLDAWPPCLWAYLVLQCVSLFYFDDDSSRNKMTKSDKIIIIISTVINMILIILSMRGWTLTVDKRSDIIMGVQGRYFLPLFLLLFLCVQRPTASVTHGHVGRTSGLVMSVVLAIDIISVILAVMAGALHLG